MQETGKPRILDEAPPTPIVYSVPGTALRLGYWSERHGIVELEGEGKMVSVNRAKLRIKLAHEPIKSLGWSAMMMDFSVAKASLLDGLKEGVAVQVELGKTKPEELVWLIAKIERR